ncbi:MAG: hypothetical protein WDW36_002774 [Sanguina aurantia]
MLLDFGRQVSNDCLRLAVTYLPICYDDLLHQSGCCSLRCRAATSFVPAECYAESMHVICSAHSELVPYFINATRRCYSSANPITCSMLLDNPHLLSAQQRSPGDCPIASVKWPTFNALTVGTGTLNLLYQASAGCHSSIQSVALCLGDLPLQSGCCSFDCSLALRSIPSDCQQEFQRQLCTNPAIGKYAVSAAQRCIGGPADCSNVLPLLPPEAAAIHNSSIAAQQGSLAGFPNVSRSSSGSASSDPSTPAVGSGSGLNFTELMQPVTNIFG